MTEPTVVPSDSFRVPCPFCGELLSHKGTCDLSFMRSGRVYTVVAVPVAVDVPSPTTEMD